MDHNNQGMKGPVRRAPSIPGAGVTRYSPVTNWDDDPFGADLFEPTPNVQKKKPPPRPPPPKLPTNQPDMPTKPSHFIRRPTVLSSLLSRNKPNNPVSNLNNHTFNTDLSEVDTNKVFPKCEPKTVHTGALIDLSSPPSSPTFTTRSSSDGLSVDSFGSDATTSTNHHNHQNGNVSQTESGFEDDFDLFLNVRKVVKDDTIDHFASDPFSPQIKPMIIKKPVIARDPCESSQSRPTIIRAKPARPKPPDNFSLLKTTFAGSFPVTPMTVNTTTPIQKVNGAGGFGDSFESQPLPWEEWPARSPPSPPMPREPPPPPPAATDDDLPELWPSEPAAEPHGVALFDYFTDHPDDLCFSVNTRIKLIRRVDHAWLFGSLEDGSQGIFPCNYIEIRIPLEDEAVPPPPPPPPRAALHESTGALPGDSVLVRHHLDDQWLRGEWCGEERHFPNIYDRMS